VADVPARPGHTVFPEGLTGWDAKGPGRPPDKSVSRESGKVLVVVHDSKTDGRRGRNPRRVGKSIGVKPSSIFEADSPVSSDIGGPMSKVGDVMENPVTGEREMVRIGTEQTDGELLVVDLYIWPGGAVIGEHRHPAIEERTLEIIQNSRPTMASYVGLTIDIIVRMENCSLIRYRGREFVVSTHDLLEFEDREPAALVA
jgi:hypothetical protein